MSALTSFKGNQPWLYDIVVQNGNSAGFGTTLVIDASGEKAALIGSIWHPTVKTGTINIRKVHFRLGAMTFNAASTIRVSLQNVSMTAGPPYQPDGTQDQTYDFASGSGLTANAWNSTGNLSADRAVDLSASGMGDTNSRVVAVVFEYGTFTAADSLIISTMNLQATSINTYLGGNPILNTGSWATVSAVGNLVAFECDDGSYAFMEASLPFSAFSSVQVGSASAIRAAGLKFRFPMELTTEAMGIALVMQNAADGNLVLYDTDGTTALITVAIDNDAVCAATIMRHAIARYQPVTHAANSYYRLVYVATSTTDATVYYGDVNAAGLMDGLVGGQDFHWTTRDSGGTWTDVTTRRPHLSIRISSVHDGASSGGMVRHPGLNGGING